MFEGGGQLSRRPHLLSADGRVVLACIAHAVRAYSAQSGELLFTLRGHTDEVTCIVQCLNDAQQVYTSSLDGTIRLWDLRTGSSSRTLSVGHPVESVAVTRRWALASIHWRGGEAGRVLCVDLMTGSESGPRTKLSSPARLASGGARGRLVAACERHSIHVWDLEAGEGSRDGNLEAGEGSRDGNLEDGEGPRDKITEGEGRKDLPTLTPPSLRPLTLTHTRRLAALALSPDGATLAAGDVSGRVLIWHRLERLLQAAHASGEAAGPPRPTATVHWHAHAVGCLAFTSEGGQLLSGGLEAVLVAWDVVSGQRRYLPRLGGPIVGLSTSAADPSLCALRQADNALRVVSLSSMRVLAAVHGIRPRSLFERSVWCSGEKEEEEDEQGASQALCVQPGTGHLVLAAPQCCLQFYDALRDRHADRLRVRELNALVLPPPPASSSGRPDVPSQPSPGTARVRLAAFSADGRALVTADSRPEADGRSVHSVRFWRASPGRGYGAPFALAASCDDPHRGSVDALALAPDGRHAATASRAGEFKLWARRRLSRAARMEAAREEGIEVGSPREGAKLESSDTWRCVCAGGYRGLPMRAAAFSADASLLAVGAGPTVAVWSVEDARLLGVLPPALPPASPGAAPAPVTRLACLGGDAARKLLVSSADGTAVVDLLSLRVDRAWRRLAPLSLAADPSSAHWAVVARAQSQEAGLNSSQKEERAPCLMLFRGALRAPVAAWTLRRGGLGASAAFVPGDTPLGARAAPRSAVPGCAALLCLGGDREFAVAAAREEEALELEERLGEGALESPGARELRGSRAVLAMPVGAEDGRDGIDAVASLSAKKAPHAMLEGPSHALAPLAELCPAFLDMMLDDV